MNIKSRISASGALLARLKILLLENRGHVYLPGIDNMLTQLTVIETDEVQRIERARATFKGMLGGAGTLGDFMIWTTNQTTTDTLNAELNQIISNLWGLLECE
ncbi:hypothetical protein DXT88_20370 [Herbaspirillum lusitanum]|uniref:hypothetical protein n=1 Tax=Herbaspirillum lusitanum TaxID=213312 RepID=UPI00223806C7|nr:hypothetical protein [Herbaspirillum lusitanum]MCW5300529.1 hypothetical protein [Herbaspirillum lusitanum]